MPPANPAISTPHSDLEQRYFEACTALADAHRNYARVLVAELEAKTQAWFNDAPTIAERDKRAQHAALTFSRDAILHAGEIKALEATIRYLEWALSVAPSVSMAP